MGHSEYQYSDAELACSSKYLLPVLSTVVMALPKGGLVMDLGCGNGSLLAQFRNHGLALHGLDESSSGVAEGRCAFPEIDFGVADLTSDLVSHPLAGTCDLVISTEVVEHVLLPRAFARNCYNFLKPGGRAVISTPYHGYLKNVLLAVTGQLDAHFTALWDYGHIKFWSRNTLSTLLREAGFRIDAFYGAGRLPGLWKSMVLVVNKPLASETQP